MNSWAGYKASAKSVEQRQTCYPEDFQAFMTDSIHAGDGPS